MEALELTEPKTESLCFKVSKKDKDAIIAYVEKKNWRMSAFLRVSVLKNIIEELEKEEG